MKNKKIIFGLLPLLAPWVARADVPLYNPLKANDVETAIQYTIRGVLGIVGAIALIYLIIGGVTWLTSQGNKDRITRGKDTLVWAIFGLVMIFVSYVILNFIMGTLLVTR
ncbi:MAG: pilin [Patescibacteria group bacterium]